MSPGCASTFVPLNENSTSCFSAFARETASSQASEILLPGLGSIESGINSSESFPCHVLPATCPLRLFRISPIIRGDGADAHALERGRCGGRWLFVHRNRFGDKRAGNVRIRRDHAVH